MGNPHWRIDSGGMDDQNYGAITFMYVYILRMHTYLYTV